jgi:hypothetical protein
VNQKIIKIAVEVKDVLSSISDGIEELKEEKYIKDTDILKTIVKGIKSIDNALNILNIKDKKRIMDCSLRLKMTLAQLIKKDNEEQKELLENLYYEFKAWEREIQSHFSSFFSNKKQENEQDKSVTVAMLATTSEGDRKLAKCCAYVANYEKVNFYYFTPQDIIFHKKKILGKFYEKGQWVN